MELFSQQKEMLFISLLPLVGVSHTQPEGVTSSKLAESWGPVVHANLKIALAHYGQEIRYHGVNFQPLYQTQISEEIHC